MFVSSQRAARSPPSPGATARSVGYAGFDAFSFGPKRTANVCLMYATAAGTQCAPAIRNRSSMRLIDFRRGCFSAALGLTAAVTMMAGVNAQTAPAPAETPSAAAPAASAAPGAPSATTTVLQGTVRSGTGLPVAGAAVKLSGASKV